MWVATVGDSRAVLFETQSSTLRLTLDSRLLKVAPGYTLRQTSMEADKKPFEEVPQTNAELDKKPFKERSSL